MTSLIVTVGLLILFAIFCFVGYILFMSWTDKRRKKKLVEESKQRAAARRQENNIEEWFSK